MAKTSAIEKNDRRKKAVAGQAGKRHGMIKRTKKFIRDARGSTILSPQDAKIVKGYMPYDR